jgi:PIN domain nuclease of toxin-antitoxin system
MPERLPASVRARLTSRENDVLFSAASIWEFAIKQQIGRVDGGISPEELVRAAEDAEFEELGVTAAHAMGVRHLPLHHRDPFDRLLVSQAIAEPARLLTADSLLDAYGDIVERIG